MCSPEVWNDARARIVAAALVPADRIAWPNETFSPPDLGGDPTPLWMTVEASGEVSEPIELGGGVWGEAGEVYVHCFAPVGAGADDLRYLAKSIANTFRGLPPAPVVYTSAEIGYGETDDDGAWYRISVRIRYRFQDR